MEVQKRKRIDDEEIENKQVKIMKDEEENEGTIVDDDEVEEFYAILKRIRVAMKYFEKVNAWVVVVLGTSSRRRSRGIRRSCRRILKMIKAKNLWRTM